MSLGKSSTRPRCTARNGHLLALLVHYRCPTITRFVTVLPLRHCWWVCSANKGHPEALANATAPNRCREQRRGTAAVPIHIRWGVVFLWQGREVWRQRGNAAPTRPASPQLGAMVETRAA
ncbi:hypothetical protein B0H14DRAFT_3867669 [Mycena olivaceomarginata]|nr:hypothetical protein B0H14DRAFT_3867669 [Mycena olivaceomarginata]